MSFNEQQSNEGGWQTVRSGRQEQAFGRRAGGFGQNRDDGRPAFGRQEQAGGMERPAFGRRQDGGGGGRADAPAAFGGGNSDRRQQEEARATSRAAEAREKKKGEDAIAAKQAEAENFTSENSYPSLGSSSKTATSNHPSLNFKQAVKDMITKEAEIQMAATTAAEEAAYANATTIRESSRQPFSRQRILDELEDDYSGPEEGHDDDDGEVNADIGSGRRRGDKGFW